MSVAGTVCGARKGYAASVIGIADNGCAASGDNWNFNASNPCVYRGGNYSRNDNYGLFYRNYNSVTNSNGNHGSRLLGVASCGSGASA